MSRIILNKENYFENLRIIEKKIGSKDKISVVLKDNAYGHGLLEIAKLAQGFGIKKAVVQLVEEAVKIENLFEEILILADTNVKTYSHTFHITINDLSDIYTLPKNTQVHLKIDTGMHRNGISENQLKEAILSIYKQGLILTGIFTHHRSADKLSCDFYWQNRNFARIKKNVFTICEQLSLSLPKFHSANSSALFRFNNYPDDFARIGLAQYGYLENDKVFKEINLKPVLELWADKNSSRLVKKGQRVGYSSNYEASENITVSNYDIGYGDGFLRYASNKGFKSYEGYELLGNISMDNTSFLSNKEKICIFKDVKKIAALNNTFTYEILTSLKSSIKKVIE